MFCMDRVIICILATLIIGFSFCACQNGGNEESEVVESQPLNSEEGVQGSGESSTPDEVAEPPEEEKPDVQEPDKTSTRVSRAENIVKSDEYALTLSYSFGGNNETTLICSRSSIYSTISNKDNLAYLNTETGDYLLVGDTAYKFSDVSPMLDSNRDMPLQLFQGLGEMVDSGVQTIDGIDLCYEEYNKSAQDDLADSDLVTVVRFYFDKDDLKRISVRSDTGTVITSILRLSDRLNQDERDKLNISRYKLSDKSAETYLETAQYKQ